MSSNGYIPRNVIAFCFWLEKLLAYAKLHYERWGVLAPDETMDERLKDLQILTNKCADRDHSPIDTLRRNEVHKPLERDIRHYLQGMVMHNINVTEEDRKLMGLPVYDRTPTPVGNPVGLVSATVKYVNTGALELHIAHVENTPYDKRANYGVRIVYDVFPINTPEPESASALHRSAFTRRKKELFTFGETESRKMAFFRLRYENSKGKAGQWGPMLSAVIP